ncbi:MAG: putative Butyryl-CoA dehydrogenase [Candidatus Rokubacteria bacterium CSP1-6]|nr:MAG: putative Butyryl-CoA dehydrogenase [Candidatus Rokubacteria bacterium CSP1-6]
MNRIEEGRSLLRRWEESKPTNFYEDDQHLRRVLAFRVDAARLAPVAPLLHQAGADAAGPVSRASALLDRPEHLPRLEPWNGIGERTEEIVFHPAYHEVGRLVWRSRVLSLLGEPGNVALHTALAYLFAQNGEVPHLCPVACTSGLIKAIQRCGSDWMRREWLPRLLDPDYDRRWHGAQFLTEVQGGSDVGANACVARPVRETPGAWRISGEKWFCSNVHADLYAVSARPEGAPEGTKGIGLFVIPRRLDNGSPNGVFIRRLKQKLGTRTLPTAEVDFQDALGYQLGSLEEGFRVMMGVIINTSRLGVALGSCGIMRRAWVEALHYARAREAFGRRLIEFPAVREQLAEMRALGVAGLSSTLFLAALEDRLALEGTHPEDDPLFRIGVNVNKYICSVDGGLVVHHGIEILGGNGTIEDFSPLPRLYREMPVEESWEGPHNTMMAQILRDALKSKMHDALLGQAEDTLLGVKHPALAATREAATAGLQDGREKLHRLLRRDPEAAALGVRRLVHRMARIFQASLLLEEADQDLTANRPTRLPEIARFFVSRYVEPGYDPAEDPGYGDLIRQIVE